MTTITKSVTRGQKLVVHLTNVVSEASYEVYFSPVINATQDSDFAPIVRSDKELFLSTRNTPLMLELAGTYRFIKVTGTGDECILTRIDAVDSFLGDVKA